MLAPMASAPLVPATAAPAFMLQQQQKGIKVSGTVVDDENSPLIGVSVTVKGSKDAAITDIDGHFYISVPSKNSVLVFNYLGFKQQEVRVGSDINFNIQLKEDAVATDEVVVVGYGNQKKLSVIGSIQTLDPGKLQVGSSRSLSNNLAGQLAGIIAVKPSGEPGYQGRDQVPVYPQRQVGGAVLQRRLVRRAACRGRQPADLRRQLRRRTARPQVVHHQGRLLSD